MTTINAPIPSVPTLSQTQMELLSLTPTNALHQDALATGYIGSGAALSSLGGAIGADAVLRTGTFEDAMLRALDSVSADQEFSNSLVEAAIVDPESVDTHDLTIAQAKAQMSLNIARTLLSRVVQGWRDIINTR